jgi:hypothetical protein
MDEASPTPGSATDGSNATIYPSAQSSSSSSSHLDTATDAAILDEIATGNVSRAQAMLEQTLDMQSSQMPQLIQRRKKSVEIVPLRSRREQESENTALKKKKVLPIKKSKSVYDQQQQESE